VLASQAAMSLENTRLYRDLAKREAKIRRLVDANVVGILIWDLDGTILEANDAFLRMVGYEREDLVSGRLSWTDLTPAQWRGRDRRDIVEQIQRTRSVQPFEWEYCRKDGSRVPVLAGAASFEGESQGVGFVLDLTERKRVEQALRQSEAYLAEAQRLTHAGSWVYDHILGKVKHYSDEAFRLFGLDPRRSSGPPQLEETGQLIHPEDRERVFEQLAQIFSDKAEYEQDYRIVLPDGTVRHLHSIGHPVLDQAGELVEYFGTVIDVTERKCAEQRLLATVDELQLRVSMLQHIPVAAWSVMPDGTSDIVNQLWFEYTGQTPEHVNSHPEAWMATLHPEDRETAAGIYWDGIRSGRGFAMEARFLRARDGAYRWHLNRAVAVRDSEGNILRFVGTSTDVHDWRQAQEDLRNTQAELAHTTRVLTMGELTASIAHEVNQPLGAIVTSAGACERWLAAKPPQMEKARRALERIVNDGKRAGEVIKRIRALMKRQALQKEWLQINEAILEVIAIAQHQLRRNAILLEKQLAEGLPLIRGDRVQLQQVLLNLIINAMEAMSGIDGRRRELTIVSVADGPEAVAVEVRDSGMGVDPERAAHLFEPFYTTKAEGLGIGLSISRTIVEAHGGHLSAAANVPHGAVFRFSVPLEESVS
jgi:PAS domain S-box-containing protein